MREYAEEDRGSSGRQNDMKKIEREGSDVVFIAGLTLRSGDGGTDRHNNRSCRFVQKNWSEEGGQKEVG